MLLVGVVGLLISGGCWVSPIVLLFAVVFAFGSGLFG